MTVKSNSGGFKLLAILILIIVLVSTFANSNSGKLTTFMDGWWRGSPSLFRNLDLATMLFLGAILIITSFFVPKKPWEWLGKALMGIGVLVMLISGFNSGFGTAYKESIEAAEKCAESGVGCENFSTRKAVSLPSSVLIPSCNTGWSTTIEVRPSFGTISWSWDVEALYRWEGRWYRQPPDTHRDADAVRFCSLNNHLNGKEMPLYWD